MRYKPGQSGNPNGRQAGIPNKITTSIKEAFKIAFDELGGAEALAEWGKENKTEFYKLSSKLIPTDMNMVGVIAYVQPPSIGLSHEANLQLENYMAEIVYDEPANLLPAPETA